MKNASVQRSHKIVERLCGHYMDGMNNKELADAVGTNPVNISRDLAALEELGYVKKLETGRWALTLRPLQLMQTFYNKFNEEQARMAEIPRNIQSAALRQGD